MGFKKELLRICSLAGLFVIVCLTNNNIVAQQFPGANGMAPQTTRYMSEYLWLGPTKMKFTFYTYRDCITPSIYSAKKFPDTCYLNVFYNRRIVANDIITIRDSIFSHPLNQCTGLPECPTETVPGGLPGSDVVYSIHRYSGIIDFSDSILKDTLDRLNACNLDIAFMGYYNRGVSSNIQGTTHAQYAYLTINRCLTWKKGDRSPLVNVFEPITRNAFTKKGIVRFDFSYTMSSSDSLSYKLTQPKFYDTTTGNFMPFSVGFSPSYYIDSYCPTGPPCNATPNSNPPKGFYLDPATGITKHYNTPPLSKMWIFNVECQSFKRNDSGKMEYASSLIRLHYPFATIQDVSKSRPPSINIEDDYYYCEDKADTISFNITDTLAINQTIKDTIDLSWQTYLPGTSKIWITNPGQREPELKLVWHPPVNSYLLSPYHINVYAKERLCDKNKTEVFKTANFVVVPTPRFERNYSLSDCGVLDFSTQTQIKGSYLLNWVIYNKIDTVITSSKATGKVDLPYAGKWYIRLNVENADHGCSNNYFDSVIVNYTGPDAAIYGDDLKVCPGKAISLHSKVLNPKDTISYMWKVNGVQLSTDSILNLKADNPLNILLTISSGNGCLASDSTFIDVLPAPLVYGLPDTSFCYGSSIDIKASKHLVSDTITWMYNDSHSSQQTLYLQGTYILQYTNLEGCKLRDSFKLIEGEQLFLSRIDDFNVCKGDSIRPILATNPNISFDSTIWFVNGIKSNFSAWPIDTITQFRIKLYGTKHQKQCTEEDTFTIIPYPKPTITLIIDKDSFCNSKEVVLNIESVQVLKSAYVNWGDGFSDTLDGETPHLYSNPGTYTLSVVAQTSQNCKDTSYKDLLGLEAPILRFIISDTSLCELDNTLELNLSSDRVMKHYIKWGDGINIDIVGNSLVQHHYGNSGEYKISIAAVHSNGCGDTIERVILIQPNPQVDLNAKGFCIGDTTVINAYQSIPVVINTYLWYLDGGAWPNINRINKLYGSPGQKIVTLQTISENNCEDNDTLIFQVLERPLANFDFMKMDTAQGYKLKFIDKSVNSDSWKWTFGSYSLSNSKNPIFILNDTGLVTVILEAGNRNLCFDTISKVVPIIDNIRFFFPSSFSPDGNGINEGFGLDQSQTFMIHDYHLEVFNRWGEKLFVTDDPTQMWIPIGIQQGIYIYRGHVRDIYNVLHEFKGVVQILK